jgi:rhamnosyl/mannosyltransferase
VHWHSDVVRQRVALWAYRPLQEWLLRRADVVIATSVAYAESSPWLKQWRHKVAVVPIGISDRPAGPWAEGARQIRQAFAGRKIVFSLGRMTYYKGFEVLIDAAENLPDDCVVIAGGGGELLDHYRDQVSRRGLGNKIVFVGHIAEQDLGAYFAAATVFCLASTHRAEAYGVVLLEAMEMAKPLVATNVPGSAIGWINQSGVTGLNVPVGDARALAEALAGIVGDAASAERLGQAARARFLECFRADAMVDSLVDLYTRLVARDGTPAVTAARTCPAEEV